MITFPDDLKVKLEDTLLEIAETDLNGFIHNRDSVNLFWGNSGLALFYHHLYQETKQKKYLDKAVASIEKAIESSNELSEKETAFCAGIAGFAWTINYLSKFDEYDIDGSEYLAELDKVLYSRTQKAKLEPVYDPMYGTLGYASYFLAREGEIADKALAEIVDFVDFFKIEIDGGYAWESEKSFVTKRSLEKAIRFNMGLAHGVPAVLLLLSRIYERGIEQEKCKEIIYGGYRWMKAQNKRYLEEYPQFEANFPHHVKTTGEMRQAKISWCYGDLSIAIALAQIAKRLDDDEMFEFSRKVGLEAAKQVPQKVGYTDDVGFCHGSAGNGFMFYKLDKIFDERMFKGASILYYKFLTYQKRKEVGVAGFQSVQYDPKTEEKYMHNDASILTGSAGIGLCLLAVLYDSVDTYWDNCFLLS